MKPSQYFFYYTKQLYMMTSSLITYEIMVKNLSTFFPNSPNNYVDAITEDSPPTYIWPRNGSDSSHDTSRFHLPISEYNAKAIQVVSFQILTNSTDNTVKPEYIVLEDSALTTNHRVVGSSGKTLGDIFATLNTTSNYQKSFGSLNYTVEIPPQFNLKTLNIRFFDADQNPFNLASELAFVDTNTPKGFHALLTVRVYY